MQRTDRPHRSRRVEGEAQQLRHGLAGARGVPVEPGAAAEKFKPPEDQERRGKGHESNTSLGALVPAPPSRAECLAACFHRKATDKDDLP